MFKGGKVCRYLVRWGITKAARIRRARNVSMLLLPTLNVPAFVFDPLSLLATVPLSVAVYAILDRATAKTELIEINSSMEQLTASRDQLMDQLDANYNNAMLTNEIGQAISSLDSIDRVLKSVVGVLGKRLDFDRGMIMLANEERTRLSYRAGFGHIDEHRFILERASFRLDNPDSRGVFVEAFKQQKPFLVNDFEAFERRHTTHSINVAKALGVKSFVCCPIVSEGEALGVLAVDNLKTSRSLMQRDKSLLMGIAPVIGVAIRNAEHLLAKDREFSSTLQVLAASIDARDPLTAGHSEKVTELSVGICNAMGLDVEFRECVRVASLLHDYGKIGVPDAILKKDGRLNQEEYEVIKTHSNKTRDILSQITFEGKYQDVPEIAGSHHEKWDGQGYPDGLSGEDIHLGARIVAVADFYEAVTSKRHYRDPMPTDVAVRLVREQSGTAFDPVVVDAFLRYLEESEDRGPQEGEGGDGGGQKVCVLRKTRVPVKAHAEIKTEQRSIKGQAHDVSDSGAYLSVSEDMGEGLMIRVTLHLPGYDRPLEAAGRIAWVNNGDRRPKPHFPEGIGVEFTAFNESSEHDLQDYVQQNQPVHKYHGTIH
jgi:HD-GYP domain-containing protein (c-di-GMP phosphodiesterase class II)